MKRSGRRRKLTDSNYRKIIEDEVFDHQDFKRQIQETAHKLDLPEEVVEVVVKNYIWNFAKIVNTVRRKIPRRLHVPAWLHVDIVEPIYLKSNNLKKAKSNGKPKSGEPSGSHT